MEAGNWLISLNFISWSFALLWFVLYKHYGLSTQCRISNARSALTPCNSSFFGRCLSFCMSMTAISEVFFQSCSNCIWKWSTDLMKTRKTCFLSWHQFDQGLIVCLCLCWEKGLERRGLIAKKSLVFLINICKITLLVFLVLNNVLLFQTTTLGNSPTLWAVRVLN